MDVAPDELGVYCRRALDAAADLPSEAAVARLVTLIRAGLYPPAEPSPARRRTRR